MAPGITERPVQKLIDDYLGIPEADLVVAVLQKSLGHSGNIDGTAGTEHEIGVAPGAWESQGCVKPQLLICFDRQPGFSQTVEETTDLPSLLLYRLCVRLWLQF